MVRTGGSALMPTSLRTPRNAAEFALRELAASITAEIRRSAARANDQAARLENIANDAMDAVGDLHLEEPPEELAHRAHRLRGVVLNAYVVLSELQLIAGQLDTLATMQRSLVRSRD